MQTSHVRKIEKKNITDYEIDDLLSLVDRHEEWVDRNCLNLYAASNILNAPTRRMLGSTIASRVAEGDVGGKFYQMGVEFLEELERVAIEGLKYLYRSDWAEPRVLSGTMANIGIELALTQPGDTIMSISLSSGSHTSHTSVGFPVFFGLNVVDIPFDGKKMDIDLVQFEDILKSMENKPKLVIMGGSLFVFKLPIKEVRGLLDRYSPETVLVFDAAHVDGLIVGGAYPNPLEDGASIISGSTYKSLGGPPGGFIVGNGDTLYKKVKRSVYPGLTTCAHYNRIGALAVTCLGLIKHGQEYANQVVRNSRALGSALNREGVQVVGKDGRFSDTHQVLVSLERQDVTAPEIGRKLADANIITSPQLLPSEPRGNVRNPKGIRLGTQELTRLGMKETDMETVAGFMADVMVRSRSPLEVASEVSEFRARFEGPYF
jgi:glycine hydroxymethyltransferase